MFLAAENSNPPIEGVGQVVVDIASIVVKLGVETSAITAIDLTE